MRRFRSTSPPILLQSTTNGVTTLAMNTPKQLNGWTQPMMAALATAFAECALSKETQAVILTGADPYYCAGVNLGDALQPLVSLLL